MGVAATAAEPVFLSEGVQVVASCTVASSSSGRSHISCRTDPTVVRQRSADYVYAVMGPINHQPQDLFCIFTHNAPIIFSRGFLSPQIIVGECSIRDFKKVNPRSVSTHVCFRSFLIGRFSFINLFVNVSTSFLTPTPKECTKKWKVRIRDTLILFTVDNTVPRFSMRIIRQGCDVLMCALHSF